MFIMLDLITQIRQGLDDGRVGLRNAMRIEFATAKAGLWKFLECRLDQETLASPTDTVD
jgi:hypothetical protein